MRQKLKDVKPVTAWGWIYHDPFVLSHGQISSFKKESARTDADQVQVVLMTTAAFREIRRELEAWKAEAIEHNPERVSQRNAMHAISLQKSNARLRRKR